MAQLPCLLFVFCILFSSCAFVVPPNHVSESRRTTLFARSDAKQRRFNYLHINHLAQYARTAAVPCCRLRVFRFRSQWLQCIKMPHGAPLNLGQCNMHTHIQQTPLGTVLVSLLMTVQKCECKACVRNAGTSNTWNYLKLHFTFIAAAVAAQKKPKR